MAALTKLSLHAQVLRASLLSGLPNVLFRDRVKPSEKSLGPLELVQH